MKIVRKSDDEPVNEDDCKVEEVEFDENENDLYDPDVSLNDYFLYNQFTNITLVFYK